MFIGAGLRSKVKSDEMVLRSVRKEWTRVINGVNYTFVLEFTEYSTDKKPRLVYTVYTTWHEQMLIHRFLRILP